MKEISETSANFDHSTDYGTQSSAPASPLYAAVLKEDSEFVEALLDAGADANPPNEAYARNPLCAAIMRWSNPIPEILIAAGADVNTRMSNFDTPLHVVAQCGNVTCFKSLIERGADLNAANANF